LKTPAANERFGVRRGVGSWDTLQAFWKFASRPSLCEPPPDRQAAGRYRQGGQRSAIGKREKSVADNEVKN